MKKLFKTAVNFMAVALASVCAFSFAACEDIKKLELSLSLYNTTDGAFYVEDDVKFSVDLYRHLAPKTVDKVIEYVKSGYYDNAIFYIDESSSSQIMTGDLKFENGELKQNLIDGKLPSEIYGEFEYGGTTGSNLLNEKGSIGLWRSYYADGNSKTSSNAFDSGRATWFIPTSSITGYDGYYCVFAQYDVSDTANSKAISAISGIFANSEYYTEYVVYFTGDYDSTKADENYGLTFHALTKDKYNEEYDSESETVYGEKVFVAEGQQLVSFNKRTLKIPNVINGESVAKIKTVKVK